jgi:hypothetical protein
MHLKVHHERLDLDATGWQELVQCALMIGSCGMWWHNNAQKMSTARCARAVCARAVRGAHRARHDRGLAYCRCRSVALGHASARSAQVERTVGHESTPTVHVELVYGRGVRCGLHLYRRERALNIGSCGT